MISIQRPKNHFRSTYKLYHRVLELPTPPHYHATAASSATSIPCRCPPSELRANKTSATGEIWISWHIFQRWSYEGMCASALFFCPAGYMRSEPAMLDAAPISICTWAPKLAVFTHVNPRLNVRVSNGKARGEWERRRSGKRVERKGEENERKTELAAA